MKAGLIESWQPANAQETQLVEAIADGWLRVERALRFEAAMFTLNTRHLKRRRGIARHSAPGDDTAIAVTFGNPDHELAHNQLERYRKSAESSYYRAMDHLRRIQNDRMRREQKQARVAIQQSRYVTIPADPAPLRSGPETQTIDSTSRMGSFCNPAGEGVATESCFRPLSPCHPSSRSGSHGGRD